MYKFIEFRILIPIMKYFRNSYFERGEGISVSI